MEKTAKPIRLLSTRHLRPATLASIERLNWTVQQHAFISTRGLLDKQEVEKITEIFSGGKSISWFLFTSVNAVKWLKTAFDEAGYIFPKGISVLCVGNITAQQAEQQLKALPVVVAPNAAALLKKLPEYIDAGASICYLCGAGRLEVLPDGLKAAGYKLTEVNVYATLYTPVFCTEHFDFVLFFSPSAVESFFELNSMPAAAMAVCIGHTTEVALRSHRVTNLIVSPKPDEVSMLKAIELWCNCR